MTTAGETPRPPATAEFGHVVPGGPAHDYPAIGCMRVRKFSVGPFDNNVYLVACGGTGEALLIDAAAEPERIRHEVVTMGVQIVGIVQTHGHHDHVQALTSLAGVWPVPVYAHPGDTYPLYAEPLHDGMRIPLGNLGVDVLHTPGHTPGSVCLTVNGHLFSGDTLFPAGPGNTFGDRSAFEQIMASVDRLFAVLPGITRVSPGHGLDTTLARERPHAETWRARGW